MKFAFKTIHQFNDYFKDELTCYHFFEKLRWDNKPVCPHCGSEKYYKVKPRGKFQDIPSYRCGNRECDLPFTVRTKSVFEGSKVELRKWFQAAYEITVCKNGISSIELASRIGVSQKTGWLINHKLRDMLTETEPKLLKDVTQIDESVIGGKNRNKHADKKIPHSQGRSLKGKTAVFGARGLSGKVRAKVVPDVEASTLSPIIESWIQRGSCMVSDEWTSYARLSENYFHVQINHSLGQYASGGFTTNGIENFWSQLKRAISGTHHSVSPQHLQRYVDGFSDIYNKRDITNIDRFGKAIKRCINERLTYDDLINAKYTGI